MVKSLLPLYAGYITIATLVLYIGIALYKKKFDGKDFTKLCFAVPAFLQGIKNLALFGEFFLNGIYYLDVKGAGLIETHFLLVGLGGAAYIAGTGILKIFFIDVDKR